MLLFQMGVDLDRVTGGNNLTEITFGLISWAKQRGQVARLIAAAHAGNSENPLLIPLAADAQSWFADQRKSPALLDDPPPGGNGRRHGSSCPWWS